MKNLVTDLKALQEETLKNLKSSKASNTIRAYKSDFKDFVLFCIKNGFKNLPSDPKIVSWLKDKKIKIIPVPFQETIELGCNVVALGNDRVLLPKASQTLKKNLKAEGFEIFDPELSMITQGGGGVHCMCQSLRRESV